MPRACFGEGAKPGRTLSRGHKITASREFGFNRAAIGAKKARGNDIDRAACGINQQQMINADLEYQSPNLFPAFQDHSFHWVAFRKSKNLKDRNECIH